MYKLAPTCGKLGTQKFDQARQSICQLPPAASQGISSNNHKYKEKDHFTTISPFLCIQVPKKKKKGKTNPYPTKNKS